MTNTINKQNKTELGMNRNDFYEYKKHRVVDLVKKGAGIEEIGQDLGMEERDVYAFLSRNFGGYRKLKAFVKEGKEIPTLKMASMTTEKRHVGRPKKSEVSNGSMNLSLKNEKNKLLTEFKAEIEKDSKVVVKEAMQGLEGVKKEILKNFKNDLIKDLNAMMKAI